jgi:hypothetical protein
MSQRTKHRVGVLAAAVGLAATFSLLGCAGAHEFEIANATVEESPLGGEALVQRKRDLDRAYRDMVHFNETLVSLVDRQDSTSIVLFDDFLATYLGEHLDPMLRPQWQSRHAELAGVDASLRFAKAELLIQMRYPRRVQETIDEIEKRFSGRDALLIDYPIGAQGTLGKGLEILKDRKWKG